MRKSLHTCTLLHKHGAKSIRDHLFKRCLKILLSIYTQSHSFTSTTTPCRIVFALKRHTVERHFPSGQILQQPLLGIQHRDGLDNILEISLTLCLETSHNEDQENISIFNPFLPPGNLAKRKPTRQSTTAHGGVSARAVDGNRNTQWNGRSCTHTSRQSRPWWRVDLQSIQNVKKVRLTNRGDCCFNRLRQIEIRVGMRDNNPGANAL